MVLYFAGPTVKCESMVAGYVGQIFNSFQGEGIYVGRRQVFVRFAGCSLDCNYCDSEGFRQFRPPTCQVETQPGSMQLKKMKNPMDSKQVLQHVKRLKTPDVHSVSLTGGEPLNSVKFLAEVALGCKRARLRTYLETNGASGEAMRNVVEHIDIAAIDIKLPEHSAVPVAKWPGLLKEELDCIKISLDKGAKPFVKIIVLPSTSEKTITKICRMVSKTGDVPLVLQPVSPERRAKAAPTMSHMQILSQAAARAGMNEIAIIPQVHKLIGVL